MRRFRPIIGRTEPQEELVTAGLSSLAEELVQEVLSYLRWPTNFYILSLVSRLFYRHATPKLYSTLVIAYHRPEKISGLLALLEKDPERRKFVTTLLFDEDVKSIGPNLQGPGTWPPHSSRRELTDGWDPASSDLQSVKIYPRSRRHLEISRRLRAVLPNLPNLKHVVMRHLHPSWIHPGLTEKHSAAGASDVTPLKEIQPKNLNVWQYIFEGSPYITEIYVNGVTSGIVAGGMISMLTTVCISDLFLNTNGHLDAARTWSAALAQASSLQTLCMVHVEHAHIILGSRSFPHLQALELYMVFLGDPHEPASPVFIDFLFRHSRNLRKLALSSPLWGSVNHAQWLTDKSILPNLHTLRLDHILAMLVMPDELAWVPGSSSDEADSRTRAAAIQAQKTDIIIEFVRHRPHILDVGIAGLKRPEADEFARVLRATRPMRNVFIGETAAQSLQSRTCCTDRNWGYGCEAWALYELFDGLTITRSGFRPRLPPQSWKFWKKTPL